jgi:hypothetical protein
MFTFKNTKYQDIQFCQLISKGVKYGFLKKRREYKLQMIENKVRVKIFEHLTMLSKDEYGYLYRLHNTVRSVKNRRLCMLGWACS